MISTIFKQFSVDGEVVQRMNTILINFNYI